MRAQRGSGGDRARARRLGERSQPLPEVLRLTARLYLEAPADPNRPRVTLSHFREVWRDDARAHLAARLLASVYQPLLPCSGSDGPENWYFRPDLESLDFEDVKTLQEALDIGSRSTPPFTGNPEGPHLDLIRMVFREVERDARWPHPLRFAIEHRKEIHDIRRLVRDLHPTFIRQDFAEGEHARLELLDSCVPQLGLDEARMQQLVSVIRAIPRVYRRIGASDSVTLAALSRERDIARSCGSE